MKAANNTPVHKFFGEIAAASLSNSNGGLKLTKEELAKAAEHLKGLKAQVRREAWADVVAVVEKDMDPGFLKSLKTELNKSNSSVRSRNNYVLATMRNALRSELPKVMQDIVRTTAHQEAVKTAVATQISDPESAATKAALVDLIDRARSLTEVQFIEKNWPTMVVKGIHGGWGLSEDGVRALEGLTAQFRAAGKTDPESIREFTEQLRTDWAAPVELGPKAPINGIPADEVAKRVDALIDSQNALRLIQSPRMMRVQGYQRMVDKINQSPVVQYISPQIKSMLADNERAFKAEQAVSNIVVDKNNLEFLAAKPYGKALYDVVQRVGKKMGFSKDVELVIASSLQPNAFIYTANQDEPRVTFYGPIIELFWDRSANDWIKIWLDENNKPAKEGDPGAREVSVGEYLIESVTAHELGHIRDEVVLTRATAVIMFLKLGRDVLGSGLTGAAEAEMKEMMTQVQGMMAMMPDGSIGAPTDLSKKLLAESDNISSADAVSFLNVFTKEVTGESVVQGEKVAPEDLAKFKSALSRMSRVAEETADRYPTVLQGTAFWTSLCDAVLGLAIENKLDDRHKIDDIKGLLAVGVEHWADNRLELLAQTAQSLDDLSFHNEYSHPVTAIRIKENFLFERDPDEMFVQLKNHNELPPMERLLATMQLYEAQLDQLDKEMAQSVPHKQFDALGDDFKTRKIRMQAKAVEAQMQPFLDYVNELLGPSPASTDNNAYEQMMGFIFSKENKLAKGTPYLRLLSNVEKVLSSALEQEGLSETERNTGRQRLEEVQQRLLRYSITPMTSGGNPLEMLLQQLGQ